MSAPDISIRQVNRLRHRIVEVRRKRSIVAATTGIAVAFSVLVGGFAGEMLLDFLLNLPWLVRAIAFLGIVGGTGYLCWRDVICPFRKQLHDDAIAALVEKALPIFRTRFIASIQLARGIDSKPPSGLLRALIAETLAIANTANFRDVIQTAKMKRALLIALGTIVLAAGLAWAEGKARTILFQRALLFTLPFPTHTQIVEATGNKRIGAGEDLRIEARVEGVKPSAGVIIATTASGQKREFPLDQEPQQPGKYSALLRGTQEPFKYVIKLNDATSEQYEIVVFPRPAVASVNFEQQFPRYLKLRQIPRSAGDLKLIPGSNLKIEATSSMDLSKAEVRLAGVGSSVPMEIDPKNPRKISAKIEIPGKDLTGISIHLVSVDGIESGETATYPIELAPDRPPVVKITFPERREELATAQATARIAFEASDDFGIAKAELHYVIGDSPEKTIDFDLDGKRDQKVVRRFDWKLNSAKPKPTDGSVIDYWITVEDGNSVTGPGVTATEHNQIKIVTDEEKRLDMANQLGDTMGGLKEISTSQEELNQNLGEVIFGRSPQ